MVAKHVSVVSANLVDGIRVKSMGEWLETVMKRGEQRASVLASMIQPG